MADNLTKDQRQKNMRAIKSRSRLEDRITKALWQRGFRYRKNTKDLYGKPDISIKKYKIVIFIDSCFWHCCPIHGNIPKTNSNYWTKKLKRNKERDVEVTNYYREKDWNILRLWEHEFKQDFDQAIEKINSFINYAKIRKK